MNIVTNTKNSQLDDVTGLELCDISCHKAYRRLFSDISVSLGLGQGLHVAGSNGSGKTTLLKIIAGLSSDYSGEINWHHGESGKTSIDKSGLFYLGHLTGVKAALTPLENLSWWVSLCLPTYSFSHDDVCKALTEFDLGYNINTPCHLLSAGQNRRVALARLLLSQQVVWILDEPFAALDQMGIDQVEACIKQHQRAGGMVIITSHQVIHDIELVELNISDYQEERCQ